MKHKTIAHSALAGVLALGGTFALDHAMAAEKEMEKCYGIAKAGKNDCQTANNACAGTAKEDGQGDAYVNVPKGTCDKIVGGSLEPKKS